MLDRCWTFEAQSGGIWHREGRRKLMRRRGQGCPGVLSRRRPRVQVPSAPPDRTGARVRKNSGLFFALTRARPRPGRKSPEAEVRSARPGSRVWIESLDRESGSRVWIESRERKPGAQEGSPGPTSHCGRRALCALFMSRMTRRTRRTAPRRRRSNGRAPRRGGLRGERRAGCRREAVARDGRLKPCFAPEVV